MPGTAEGVRLTTAFEPSLDRSASVWFATSLPNARPSEVALFEGKPRTAAL